MWPLACKGRLTRLDHVWQVGIFLPIIPELDLYRSNNGPAAARRVLKVLEKRIIACLPPGQVLLTEKTRCIVRLVGTRTEEEASSSKLHKRVSANPGSPKAKMP